MVFEKFFFAQHDGCKTRNNQRARADPEGGTGCNCHLRNQKKKIPNL